MASNDANVGYVEINTEAKFSNYFAQNIINTNRLIGSNANYNYLSTDADKKVTL